MSGFFGGLYIVVALILFTLGSIWTGGGLATNDPGDFRTGLRLLLMAVVWPFVVPIVIYQQFPRMKKLWDDGKERPPVDGTLEAATREVERLLSGREP